ncbi:MAG: phenylacetic acid degradation protein PaaN, partial [Myxococcota bacterium]|nr:phenylacetic acid degradation protein PaaN [Myxococcota bacterium]
MPSLFHKHQELLQKAVETCRIRDYWSPFQESPRASLHPPGKKLAGKKQFETLLGNPFPLSQPGEIGKVGIEVSPYTQRELGIRYPAIDIDVVMKAAQKARNHWTQCSVEERIGVCMELISQLDQNAFVNTYASMHTAGMSFMMGFAGSGANALDRGLEAIAYAYRAMQEIPSSSRFQRSFGRGEPTKINKTYRLQSRGVAVVIC